MEDNQNPAGKIGSDFFAKIDSTNEPSPAAEAVDSPPTPPTNIFTATPPPIETGFPPSPVAEATVLSDLPPSEGRGKLKMIFLLVAAVLLLGGLAIFFISGRSSNKQPVKAKETTLIYWGLWEPEVIINEIVADYQKTHPKIKINYVFQSQRDYRERLQSALARGEGPDIFRFHNTWTAMLKNDLAPVPATVMDAGTFERIFYPVVRTDLRVGNSYYGIPLEIDNLALFYNEDIFATAGKTPPKTWDEFRKLALELTVKDNTGKIQTAGAAMGVTKNVDHWSDILALLLLQNGADLSNPTNNLAEDALTFYTIFSRSDNIWDENLPASTYYFAIGRLAMYFAPSWRIFEIKALNPSLKFGVIPVPQLPGTGIGWATYWVEGVAKKSTHQEESWEFLKFLSTKETMQKLYQIQSSKRLFGEPYSRTDMADLLRKEPYVGVFIDQASKAKSWYLCSRTFDNGLNDKIIKYYEDAVNSVNKGGDIKAALATAARGIAQILTQYGAK